MALNDTQKTILARIEQFRSGVFSEGAHALRTLVNLGLGGAEFVASLANATSRVVRQGIQLTELRRTNAMTTALATTAGTNLLGLAAAAGSVVSGSQTNNTSVNETASIVHILPADYVAGAPITVRARAKVSAARFVSAQVDLVAKKITDGVLGADICATAAQALTTNYTDFDFTITPTGLAAGDMLQLDFYLINNDTGGSTNGTATISELSVRPTITT